MVTFSFVYFGTDFCLVMFVDAMIEGKHAYHIFGTMIDGKPIERFDQEEEFFAEGNTQVPSKSERISLVDSWIPMSVLIDDSESLWLGFD